MNSNEATNYFFSRMLRKANIIALGIFAIYTLSNIPGADGGPLTYGSCVAGCISIATAVTVGIGSVPSLPGCITLCLPLLGAPIP